MDKTTSVLPTEVQRLGSAKAVEPNQSQKLHLTLGEELAEFVRRMIEIFTSFWGLFLLSPFFALVAIAIHRDSPGPVFYHGRRMGKNGRVFEILKFRTMYESPASYEGAPITAQDDERVTPLGHWLRDTKLNELPQLWNVLKGDMSLVGPRPEDPDIVAKWPEEIRQELLSIRPGITSPASVIYRGEEKMLFSENLMEGYLQKVLPSKLRLDQIYLHNRTLLTDLDVIFMTMLMLIPRLNSLPVSENLLFWGPISRFATRVLNWFAVDFFITLIAVGVSGIGWRLIEPFNLGLLNSIILALSMALVYGLINYVFGSNDIDWSKASAATAFNLLLSVCLSTLIFLIIDNIILSQPLVPSTVVLVSALLAGAGFVAVRYRTRLFTGVASRWVDKRSMQLAIGERVLIVGAGELGTLASWLLRRKEFAGTFSIVGMLDDDPRKIGMRVADSRVLGAMNDLERLITQSDTGLVLICIQDISAEYRAKIKQICDEKEAILAFFPDLLANMKTLLAGEELERAHHLDEMEGWIDQIDSAIEKGDIATARVLLAEMKQKINYENNSQSHAINS